MVPSRRSNGYTTIARDKRLSGTQKRRPYAYPFSKALVFSILEPLKNLLWHTFSGFQIKPIFFAILVYSSYVIFRLALFWHFNRQVIKIVFSPFQKQMIVFLLLQYICPLVCGKQAQAWDISLPKLIEWESKV